MKYVVKPSAPVSVESSPVECSLVADPVGGITLRVGRFNICQLTKEGTLRLFGYIPANNSEGVQVSGSGIDARICIVD